MRRRVTWNSWLDLGRGRRATEEYHPSGRSSWRSATEWQYAGDLLTREVHPESRETTYTNQAGPPPTKTTARGTVTFGYDANDRLTLVDAPGTAHFGRGPGLSSSSSPTT